MGLVALAGARICVVVVVVVSRKEDSFMLCPLICVTGKRTLPSWAAGE